MKRFSVVILLLCLAVLSACGIPGAATPPPSGLLHTAVALTLTAQPTSSVPTEVPPTPTTGTGATATFEVTSGTLVLPSLTNTPTPTLTSTYVYPTAVYPTAGSGYGSSGSPEQFVRYYYGQINLSNYPVTWSLLTDSFKANNNPPSTGGYSGYVSFWNTVHDVQVLSVVTNSWSGGYAFVTVSAIYHYNSGTSVNTNIGFNLTYNYSLGTWMFDSPVAAVYPTPAVTPAEFITYYFNNINISNYTLTWSLLTDHFKAHNNPPSSGGYTGYVNFWNTIHDVQVISVFTSQSGGFAVSNVYALYNKNDGTSVYNTQTYNLTYNYTLGTWQFDSP